jgi:hypothetical protein
MNCCKLAWTTAAVLGALLALGPASAGAKELSDVKVDFVRTPSSDEDAAAGSLRLRLQERRAELQLRFKRLTPDAWYALVIEDEDQICLQAGGNGSVNLRMVQTADIPDPNFFDPRGADLFLERDDAADCMSDPSTRMEVLCASLDPGNGNGNGCKGPRMKVQEQTELEPTAAAEGGSAELRFRVLPQGKRRFGVRLKHVPPIEDYYYLYVGGEGSAREEMISVNSAGVGRLDFTEKPPKGNGGGKGRNQKVLFGEDFEPYDEDVEICAVMDNGAESVTCDHNDAMQQVFYGSLFAQIPGLNVCEEIDEAVADLADPTGADTPSGTATFGVDGDCDRRLEVEVMDLADGTYTVLLSGTAIDTIEVSGGEGRLRVDAELLPDPDPVGEDVLVQNSENPPATVLSGTLNVP